MAYATVADLLDRFDVRVVCEYASDTDVPVPSGSLAVDTGVIAAFEDASATIDAAMQYGQRYTRSVLEDLVADADRQKGALIRRVTCDLVMKNLISRRLAPADDLTKLIPTLADSMEWLQRLHNGDAVLDWAPAVAATLPEAVQPATDDPYLVTNYNKMFGVWPRRCT